MAGFRGSTAIIFTGVGRAVALGAPGLAGPAVGAVFNVTSGVITSGVGYAGNTSSDDVNKLGQAGFSFSTGMLGAAAVLIIFPEGILPVALGAGVVKDAASPNTRNRLGSFSSRPE